MVLITAGLGYVPALLECCALSSPERDAQTVKGLSLEGTDPSP